MLLRVGELRATIPRRGPSTTALSRPGTDRQLGRDAEALAVVAGADADIGADARVISIFTFSPLATNFSAPRKQAE